MTVFRSREKDGRFILENHYICTQTVEGIADRFFSTLQESAVLPQAYLDEVSAKIERNVKALLKSPKPKIMVYGIYNSGKSTLVNALCEKAVAQVADRPMTDRIAAYDTGKYILIDSPGVDAPAAHEKIADAELSKCHMILFVISSKGGFESRENYQKMLNIIRMGIPFYIILNDRGTVLPNDPVQKRLEQQRHTEELEEIRRKIIYNLMQVSGDQNIYQKYDVIVLNAKRAWTGIEKGRPGLVQGSNISALRLRIHEILEEQGALTWIKAPLAALDGCMNDVESQLYALEGHHDYAGERQVLEANITRVRTMLADQIRSLIYARFDSVYAFYRGLPSKDLEQIGEELFQEIQSAYKRMVAPLNLYMKKEFPGLRQNADGVLVCKRLEGAGGGATSATLSECEEIDLFDLPDVTEESAAPEFLSTAGMAALGYGAATALGSTAFGTAATEAIAAVGAGALESAAGALGSTALGTTAATALGSTALGTAATGAASTVLGVLTPMPVIGLLLGEIMNAIRKSSKREREEEARFRQMKAQVDEANRKTMALVEEQARLCQDAKTKANALLDEWTSQMRVAAHAQIDMTYAAIRQALDGEILAQQQTEQDVRQLLQSLRAFRDELAVVRLQTE